MNADDGLPVTMIGGVPVLLAPEEIDITNADVLRTALKAAGDGHEVLVVDMTRTLFCDSSGLHTLLAAHRRAAAENRHLILAVCGAAVVRIFTLSGIGKVIPCFTSMEEALGHAAACVAAKAAPTANTEPTGGCPT